MFETETNTEELLLALQHLRHNKHEVILFILIIKMEFDFAFENRLYKFVDMESMMKLKFILTRLESIISRLSVIFPGINAEMWSLSSGYGSS